MKKVLILGLVLLSLFLIYLGTMDRKVYYLALGDSLGKGTTPYGGTDYGYADFVKEYLEKKDLLEIYIKEFAENNYRTTDLKRDIIDNKKVSVNGKEKTLKNALIKADLVTLSIGTNDLLGPFSIYQNIQVNQLYDRIDEVTQDLDELFELMREYCKEDIIITGYFDRYAKPELEDVFAYLNSRVKALCDKYHIIFVDLYDTMRDSDFYPNPQDLHPSKEGYQAISYKIIEKLETSLLK